MFCSCCSESILKNLLVLVKVNLGRIGLAFFDNSELSLNKSDKLFWLKFKLSFNLIAVLFLICGLTKATFFSLLLFIIIL